MDNNTENNSATTPSEQNTSLTSTEATVTMTPPTQHLSLKNLPPLLTIKETAEILRVSPLTLKRWGKRGKLTPIRINSRGDRRYKREAILWMLGIAS